MFDNYVETITDEIKVLNDSVVDLKDYLINRDEEFSELETENELEEINILQQSDLEDLIGDEDNLLIDLNDQFDIMNKNFEILIDQNIELLESIKSSDEHNVQGFWFLFIALTVALGLKIFFDNIVKW